MKTPILISLILLLYVSITLAQTKEKISLSVFVGANKEHNEVFARQSTQAGLFYGVEMNAFLKNRKSVILHASSGTTHYFYGISENSSHLNIPQAALAKYDYQPVTNLAIALLYHYQLFSRKKWDLGVGVGAAFMQRSDKSLEISVTPDSYSIKENRNNYAFGTLALRLDAHYHLTEHWNLGVLGNTFAPTPYGFGTTQAAFKVSYWLD